MASVKKHDSLTFNLVFFSTHDTTSGSRDWDRVGWHLFSVTKTSTRGFKDDICWSRADAPLSNFTHKSFKLRPVVSKCSAHYSGVTGAPHLEGGYCHELTIFMTSTQLHMAKMKAAMMDPNHPALLNAPTLRI